MTSGQASCWEELYRGVGNMAGGLAVMVEMSAFGVEGLRRV